jgi:hypothetical protein
MKHKIPFLFLLVRLFTVIKKARVALVQILASRHIAHFVKTISLRTQKIKQIKVIASLAILSLAYTGCLGQSPDETSVKPVSEQPSTPRPKPKPRVYGDYVFNTYDQGTIHIKKDSLNLQIREAGSGILIHSNNNSHVFRVEYYDTSTHTLKKSIDLDKTTPYNSTNYRNIKIGKFDYETMESVEVDSNCNRGHLPKPKMYLTSNSESFERNGHLVISWELIKMADAFTAVDWEETLLILDPFGNEVTRLKFNSRVSANLSKSKNNLIVTQNRQNQHHISEPCHDAIMIYDLSNNKCLFKKEVDQKKIIGIMDINADSEAIIVLVYSKSLLEPRSIYEVIVFKEDTKEISTYFIPLEQQLILGRTGDYNEFKNIYIKSPFTTQKIK